MFDQIAQKVKGFLIEASFDLFRKQRYFRKTHLFRNNTQFTRARHVKKLALMDIFIVLPSMD
jgi:hypothetical protein